MAPTPSPIPVLSLNHPFGRYFHHLRRQGLNFSRRSLKQPSVPRIEQSQARTQDLASQPSVVPEGPPPPLITPTPSESIVLGPEPSGIPSNRYQGPIQPIDISGNIAAAVVVIVLILGGLIGLVVGGEMQRRRTRTTRERTSPSSRCLGRRKSKRIKGPTSALQQRTRITHEKSLYGEKTLTPVARPPHALSRERQRRFSNIWPIRNLSMAVYRSCPEQVECSVQPSSPAARPQTTWSEFSPVLLYAAPPRTVLDSIPEELEDCPSQTDSDIAAILALQRSLESGSTVSTTRTNQLMSSHSALSDVFSGAESSVTTKRRCPQNFQTIHEAAIKDEDARSLGSSPPDMTSDGGESSRSSMASLESLGVGNDRESLTENVFELRRAQTRSMQMDKGVLLSLSLKALDDNQKPESTCEGCGPSRSPCIPDAKDSKDYVERVPMLGGNFSAVNLDEFPPPSSILPMIPSFVSGF